ncbi:hypothetical protein G6F32_015586 [Rhizopus arrhizus]|nr:hypothetical protein G6F32_015586 [Rhizopus arrhizus]
MAVALGLEFQRHGASNSCAGAGLQGNAGRFDLVRMHRILLVLNRRDPTAIIVAMLQAKLATATHFRPLPRKQKKRGCAHSSRRFRVDLSQVFI